jgi:hypothetical protein
MSLLLPAPFVPTANSMAVQRLRRAMGTDKAATVLSVVTDSGARERDGYINVRNRVERDGGRMQLGWAVWQHAHLFIEAEPHAVYDPGEGKEWFDCTPHTSPNGTQRQEILIVHLERAMGIELHPKFISLTEPRDSVRIIDVLLQGSVVSQKSGTGCGNSTTMPVLFR